jgi:hypothetical protein
MKKRHDTILIDALTSSFSRQPGESSAETTKILFQAEVVDNDDPLGASRIKVFIPGVDDHLISEKTKLPWANALQISNIQIIPKVGERVIIIFENPWKKNTGRWWIGPIFSANITSDEKFESSMKNSGL